MTTADRLWSLLPAVYRERDAEPPQSGFLRALVDVIGEQGDVVAEDLAAVYDGWFVETCPPWLVPYLGDLVGVRPLNPVGPVASVPRAYVANTLAYRRRKGTPAGLEQLVRDVTGWPARAVELYRLAAWSQFLGHLRPGAVTTVDLHAAAALEEVDGPFDTSLRTVDVRGPVSGTALRPNLPDLALVVWREEPFHVEHATARPVADPADGRYTVDPLGRDVPLADEPLPEDSIASLATERHVPGLLRRRVLFDELALRRGGGVPAEPSWFGVPPVFRVFADTGAGLVELGPDALTVADLSDPPPQVTTGWRRPGAPLLAAVDPVLGRVAFREGVLPTRVEVTATYLAPGRVGAGPYDRSSKVTDEIRSAATFSRAVGTSLPPRPGFSRTSIAAAVADWGTPAEGTVGVVAVTDNRTYAGDLAVTVPAGCTLLLTSGVWPDAERPPTGPTDVPVPTTLTLDERRPVVLGNVTITGGSGADVDTARGRLVLDGLVVAGRVRVATGDLGALEIRHCSLVPPAGSALTVQGGNLALSIVVDHCDTGPLAIPAEGPALSVSASIVDGEGAGALAAPETVAALDAVTVLGDTAVRSLEASDCLFTGDVEVARTQQGCVRYSYVRDDARTPRRYRCQPDLALAGAATQAGGSLLPDAAAAVRARLTPQLESTERGRPGYAVLADRSALELRTGSTGRADLGCYGELLRPQREANLRTALSEHLRVGLTAGVLHAT